MMVKWFETLPWQWQIFIVILTIISVVIISIYGKFVFQRGKVLIGIGGNKKDSGEGEKHKHPCEECYMIIRKQILETERKIKTVESSRMDRQMNFFDQKVEELQTDLLDIYTENMNKNRTTGMTSGLETVQFRLFEGLLMDAFNLTKKEIRRALRENGYNTLQTEDYITYIGNEARTLTNMVYNHLRRLYPPVESNMIVKVNEVLGLVEAYYQNIEDLIMEFFNYAKDVNQHVEEEVLRLDKECDRACSQFIGVSVQMPTATPG